MYKIVRYKDNCYKLQINYYFVRYILEGLGIKMKKVLIVFGILLVIVFIVQFAFGYGFFEPETNNSDVKIVTENYKTEIILYGDNIEFDDNCYVRKIDKITKENLTSDETFVYTVFIINDLNSTISIDNDDLKVIHNKIYNDKIDFYYFGKNSVAAIKEADIFHQNLSDTDMSLGVIYERGIITEVVGTWSEEIHEYYLEKNPALLSETILAEIVSKIRFDNK